MDDIEASARQTLEQNRVAVFVVAYNAERHIERVLRRIPEWVAERLTEIYIIDDHSADTTFSTAQQINWPGNHAPLRIFRTPYNQGYGGNQRLGYLYAIEQNFDIVVLLHGDGQYAPEALPHILAPYASGADAVFGSRFVPPRSALKGGMPLYKWLGNRILTNVQNAILGARMSEMHSGYRSYRTSALRQIPFTLNSLDFDFDADIIVQFVAAGLRIVEVPIPTYYGDEICHVNGLRYAWQCFKTVTKYRLMQYEIFYDPKFDVKRKTAGHYTAKLAETSVHYYVRHRPVAPGTRLIDVGGGQGEAASRMFAESGVHVTCIDQFADPSDSLIEQHCVDLDQPWAPQFPVGQYDTALALDVIEHLRSPEKSVAEIFKYLKSGGTLYASTGNIAYLPLRMSLLAGWFNYGRKGILDLTHTRLFTTDSFRRLLRNGGFRVDEVIGFGPPIPDLAKSNSKFVKALDAIFHRLARAWPTLFAYQIFAQATRVDSPADLMEQIFLRTEPDGLPARTAAEPVLAARSCTALESNQQPSD
ncbi:MAG: bifunctional glycosyltransferase/class I SAM-dependent methyltransferase [Verrucomicrobiota bacterium]|nr:bifunctional glycosyltransferase/class I SAM-dependent methyltransferase [Verrucomicrobiota bacterium]